VKILAGCGGQGLSPAEKKFGNFVEKQGVRGIVPKGVVVEAVVADLWVLLK
jgi:hypothetical protein